MDKMTLATQALQDGHISKQEYAKIARSEGHITQDEYNKISRPELEQEPTMMQKGLGYVKGGLEAANNMAEAVPGAKWLGEKGAEAQSKIAAVPGRLQNYAQENPNTTLGQLAGDPAVQGLASGVSDVTGNMLLPQNALGSLMMGAPALGKGLGMVGKAIQESPLASKFVAGMAKGATGAASQNWLRFIKDPAALDRAIPYEHAGQAVGDALNTVGLKGGREALLEKANELGVAMDSDSGPLHEFVKNTNERVKNADALEKKALEANVEVIHQQAHLQAIRDQQAVHKNIIDQHISNAQPVMSTSRLGEGLMVPGGSAYGDEDFANKMVANGLPDPRQNQIMTPESYGGQPVSSEPMNMGPLQPMTQEVRANIAEHTAAHSRLEQMAQRAQANLDILKQQAHQAAQDVPTIQDAITARQYASSQARQQPAFASQAQGATKKGLKTAPITYDTVSRLDKYIGERLDPQLQHSPVPMLPGYDKLDSWDKLNQVFAESALKHQISSPVPLTQAGEVSSTRLMADALAAQASHELGALAVVGQSPLAWRLGMQGATKLPGVLGKAPLGLPLANQQGQ